MSMLPLPGSHLPIHIDLRQRRVLVLDVGHDRLAEPFQTEAAQRLLGEGRAAVHVELDEFVDCYAPGSPYWTPTPLVISHVGRSGSTLLSRALDAAPDVSVHREPPLLGPIFRAMANSLTGSLPADGPGLALLLQAALSALAGFAASRDSALAVKLTSWHGALATPLGLANEATSVLLLHRQPRAVVASSLLNPPDWSLEALGVSEPLLLSSRPGFATATASPLTAVRYFCGVWNAIIDDAVNLVRQWPQTMALSYDDLVADAPQVVAAIAEGLGSGGVDPCELRPVLGSYSKSITAAPWEPTGAHGALQLSERTSNEIARRTAEPAEGLFQASWGRLGRHP